MLLSFNASTNVPGVGQVDDSDIVEFIPTKLGSDTAGSFAWYLHGADVGLTSDGEDIDAISFAADGDLVVSTIGDINTPTVSGKDEDLIQLDDISRAWRLFFDGSTVGLANEDVNGVWIDQATSKRYLTVKDSFAFTNVQIDSDDIFICTPTNSGVSTTCDYRLFWDSDQHDYGSENINSFTLGALPLSFMPAVQASDVASPTPDELAVDDDIDDTNQEELINQIFLPLIER